MIVDYDPHHLNAIPDGEIEEAWADFLQDYGPDEPFETSTFDFVSRAIYGYLCGEIQELKILLCNQEAVLDEYGCIKNFPEEVSKAVGYGLDLALRTAQRSRDIKKDKEWNEQLGSTPIE